MTGGCVPFAAPGVAVAGSVPDTPASNFVPVNVLLFDGTGISGLPVPNVGDPDVI
jgi:hypothetical protein